MKNDDFSSVKKFYNSRFIENGDVVKSVGWKDKSSQYMRFDMLFRDVKLDNATILDVGCGLGDLILYLTEKKIKFKYIGIDISDEMIKAVKEKYKSCSYASFFETDLLSFDASQFDIDIAVESGALTYKIQDNQKYAEKVLAKMYNISKSMAAANFMSSYADFYNDTNHHYQPEEIFKYCKTVSKKINLIHDYPLYEFTIQMFKN